MLNTYYYKKELRNVTVALLDMFNNIKVHRRDASGSLVKVIDVPIKFGPGEKYYLFQTGREAGRKLYPSVPSILLELTNIDYDSERASSVNEVRQFYDPITISSASDQFWTDVQPAPYNLSFNLMIRTESMDDFAQIIENIYPGFNPTNMLRVKEFSFCNIERDLKVSIGSTSISYPAEMGEEDHRYIDATIPVTVNAFFYRPILESDLIKYIKVQYFYNNDQSHAEVFYTSGMDVSATAPTDYTYSKLL